MPYSVFELFKVGIGPSSSHTVGPMVAARSFIEAIDRLGMILETRGYFYPTITVKMNFKYWQVEKISCWARSGIALKSGVALKKI